MVLKIRVKCWENVPGLDTRQILCPSFPYKARQCALLSKLFKLQLVKWTEHRTANQRVRCCHPTMVGTWSILIQWIRIVIVRWQSDLVNSYKRKHTSNCDKHLTWIKKSTGRGSEGIWLSGKTLDCRPRDCEFDPPSLQLKLLKRRYVLVLPRKNAPVYQCFTLGTCVVGAPVSCTMGH